MKRIKQALFIFLGTVTLIIGSIGIILPVLPTTPFLLLSAFFYLRSSERLYEWLINHRILGLYVRSYIKYRAISPKTKVFALSTLWITIILSLVFFIHKTFVRVVILIAATTVTFHILSLKTMDKEDMEKIDQDQRKAEANFQ